MTKKTVWTVARIFVMVDPLGSNSIPCFVYPFGTVCCFVLLKPVLGNQWTVPGFLHMWPAPISSNKSPFLAPNRNCSWTIYSFHDQFLFDLLFFDKFHIHEYGCTFALAADFFLNFTKVRTCSGMCDVLRRTRCIHEFVRNSTHAFSGTRRCRFFYLFFLFG